MVANFNQGWNYRLVIDDRWRYSLLYFIDYRFVSTIDDFFTIYL